MFLRSKQYSKALKMYRMALDQISEPNNILKYSQHLDELFLFHSVPFSRLHIRENIASTHVLMGQYAEAAQAYESIVQDRASYRSCLNLLLCYHTLGQRDKTRRAFVDLLKIPIIYSDEDYQPTVTQYLQLCLKNFCCL